MAAAPLLVTFVAMCTILDPPFTMVAPGATPVPVLGDTLYRGDPRLVGLDVDLRLLVWTRQTGDAADGAGTTQRPINYSVTLEPTYNQCLYKVRMGTSLRVRAVDATRVYTMRNVLRGTAGSTVPLAVPMQHL